MKFTRLTPLMATKCHETRLCYMRRKIHETHVASQGRCRGRPDSVSVSGCAHPALPEHHCRLTNNDQHSAYKTLAALHDDSLPGPALVRHLAFFKRLPHSPR